MPGHTLLSNSVTNVYQNIYKNLKFQYRGRWHTLDWVLRYLSKDIKKSVRVAQSRFLAEYKTQLVRALATGGDSINSPFAPWKGSYSHSGSIGVRSRNYLNALSAMKVVSSGNQVSMRIPSAFSQQRSRPKGLSLARYALIFEIGSEAGQVARPLWKDTFNFMGGPKAILGPLQKEIQSQINKGIS